MNREEVIAIIRKEYLCVDRDCDIDRSCGKCDLMMPSKEPILEAYKMAIKALEQEPKILNTLDFAIDASNGDTNYFVGFRNGLRYSKSLIDGKEPQFESCTEQEPCEDMVSRGVLEQVRWERDIAISQLKELGYGFGEKIEPCGNAIDRKLVYAFIDGLISDDREREKGLEYIRNMPPVNPQPCEDAISRQAVIDSLHSKFADGFDSDRWWNSMSVLYAINKVPPVNPIKTGWIPVSERLPKIADVYRVTRYYPNNVMNPNYLVDACFFDGSNTWYNDNRINHERDYANNVIAWQENPKPYEPQERSGEE